MIHPKILSRAKLENIILELAWDSEQRAKHPHDKLGRFARKGTGTTTSSGSKQEVGAQYKKGRQRFVIEQGQSQAEAYKAAVETAKAKRLQRQARKIIAQSKVQEGLKNWQQQAREEEYYNSGAQAREGEHQGLNQLHEKEDSLVAHAAKEAGILYGISKARDIVKKVFDKIAKPAASTTSTATSVPDKSPAAFAEAKKAGIIIPKVVDPGTKTPKEIKKKAQQAAKAAFKPAKMAADAVENGKMRAARRGLGQQAARNAYKTTRDKLLQEAASAATAQVAMQTASKVVPVTRIGKAAAVLFGVGRLIPKPPHIALAALVASAGYIGYKKYQKNKKLHELMAHERNLMNQDRNFHQQLREQTTREVSRQSSVYAAKQYAQQQAAQQRFAIDEEIGSKKTQNKMRKSARIAAHAAAKEYAKHERDQAYKTRESNSGLYFSFDESKHPRDENGRWTATPESNANLIKRTVKKPTSLKTHIASGAIVGAAIGTVNAPGIGSAIGAATGGALAATRKLTLKRTFEKANHRALQESMLKSLAGHGDVKGILKDNFKHHQFLKEASKIAVKDNETRSKLRTYISFHQATHDEKQKAIETNTLHELKPKKMLDMF